MVALNNKIITAPKEDDNTSTILIPTGYSLNPGPARHREINLHHMDEQDIKSLRKEWWVAPSYDQSWAARDGNARTPTWWKIPWPWVLPLLAPSVYLSRPVRPMHAKLTVILIGQGVISSTYLYCQLIHTFARLTEQHYFSIWLAPNKPPSVYVAADMK